MTIKVAVIYHDTAECVRALADAVTAVAWNTGADVRLRRLPGVAPAPAPGEPPGDRKADPLASAGDLAWADVVLLGAPARDGDVVGLLRRLSGSAPREPRQGWEREPDRQVLGVFVTMPEPGSAHGGLLRSFAIVYPRPAEGLGSGPQRSVATLAAALPGGTGDPTLLSLDLARQQTRRCVEIAAELRAEGAVAA